MPTKLTLERILTNYSKSCAPHYEWKFRQESYTRESWETLDIPIVCGVAGIYIAYLPADDEQDIESWKDKLKEKALQELQEARQNIQQQIDSLGNAS